MIEHHLSGILDGTDIFLVGASVDKNNRIVVYIDSPGGVSIEDCVRVSRELEGKLDRDREEFALEVSSPGLDAPFRVAAQYRKNLGKNITVVTKDGERLEGVLRDLDEKGIVLDIVRHKKPGEGVRLQTKLPFTEIKSARASVEF